MISDVFFHDHSGGGVDEVFARAALNFTDSALFEWVGDGALISAMGLEVVSVSGRVHA